MPLVRNAHHRPGTPSGDYRPASPWPENCTVQWGDHGLVLGTAGSYATAFFEAFPRDSAGGFIRGEGATIAAAEADAFQRWQRESSCEHRWGRSPAAGKAAYTNGGTFCRNCKAFTTGVMKPIVEPKSPALLRGEVALSSNDLSCIEMGLLRDLDGPRPSPLTGEALSKRCWLLRIRIGARMAGIAVPDSTLDDAEYEEAALEALGRYYLARGPEIEAAAGSAIESMGALFDRITLSHLRRIADRIAARENGANRDKSTTCEARSPECRP